MTGAPAAVLALVLGASGLFGGIPGGPERAVPAASSGTAAAPPAARRAHRAGARPCRVTRRRAGRARARCARITPRRAARRGETLADVLVRTAPGGGPSGPALVTPSSGEPPAATPQRNVSVTAREFTLLLSRPVVDQGRVGIQLRNAGEDPHNLQIAREDSPLAVLLGFPTLAPDENDRRFEDLAPGRYVLWCSLEGHEALGMSTTLDVR